MESSERSRKHYSPYLRIEHFCDQFQQLLDDDFPDEPREPREIFSAYSSSSAYPHACKAAGEMIERQKTLIEAMIDEEVAIWFQESGRQFLDKVSEAYYS